MYPVLILREELVCFLVLIFLFSCHFLCYGDSLYQRAAVLYSQNLLSGLNRETVQGRLCCGGNLRGLRSGAGNRICGNEGDTSQSGTCCLQKFTEMLQGEWNTSILNTSRL